MRAVFGVWSFSVALAACAGAGNQAAEVAPLAQKGAQFQVPNEEVEAAYGYGTVSSELPVESLGPGQTITLEPSEIQALAHEVPTAPSR
ncbi:MAG: hypothetical protein IPG45_27015 [Deltaproteobacteria bacterium]|jgi:protein-disulfide isomerase|nr:hypothetical protein [Deltaproteobacteria bacterium]